MLVILKFLNHLLLYHVMLDMHGKKGVSASKGKKSVWKSIQFLPKNLGLSEGNQNFEKGWLL